MSTADIARARSYRRQRIALTIMKGRTLIALLLLSIFFSFAAPNFTSWGSIVLVLKHASLYGLLGVGMTMVIISGGINLAVGSLAGLCGMITGSILQQGVTIDALSVTIYFSVPEIILIVCAFSVVVGLFSGFIISYLKLPPFIATLGMNYICSGMALLSSGGNTFSSLEGAAELGNTGFRWIGEASITPLQIPVSILIYAAVVLVGIFITKYTALGKHIFAVGGNEKAAQLSGIRVRQVKLFVYVFSSLCSALTGVIVTSQLMAAHPSTGEGWESLAIASVVLGGTSMSGGIGSIAGSVVGVLVITVLNDGLVMMGVSQFWQLVIKGAVIIVAVVIDRWQRDLQRRVALQLA